jgi:hypothetical protein
VTFGSSAKTSDFIVDTLAAWWQRLRGYPGTLVGES